MAVEVEATEEAETEARRHVLERVLKSVPRLQLLLGDKLPSSSDPDPNQVAQATRVGDKLLGSVTRLELLLGDRDGGGPRADSGAPPLAQRIQAAGHVLPGEAEHEERHEQRPERRREEVVDHACIALG